MQGVALYRILVVAIGFCVFDANSSNATGRNSAATSIDIEAMANRSSGTNTSLNGMRSGHDAIDDVQQAVVTWEKVEVEIPPAPRFTLDGCLCMERWRLIGHENLSVTDYCGNPDHDPRGEWCFVKEDMCQPHMNWGYCAPSTKCVVGSEVLVPGPNRRYRRGTLKAYRGRMVELRLAEEAVVEVHNVLEVISVDGDPCVQTRFSSASAVASSPASTSPSLGTSTTTTSTTSQTSARQNHEAVTSTTNASAEVFGTNSSTLTQVISIKANSRGRFDSTKHGPALALRLNMDYVEVLKQRTVIEESIISAAAAVVLEPASSIEVLALMRGSVIAALGVVPASCSAGQEHLSSCSTALHVARQRWEVALWDPNSALQRILGKVDPMFPPLLDSTECIRRGLLCPWIEAGAGLHKPCGGLRSHCSSPQAQPKAISGDRDPWWVMSVIAFAGATPTCLCFGLIAVKIFFRLGRFWQRRQRVREVRVGACSLPRIEVQVEDLHLGEDWICSICLSDQPLQGDLLLLPCKHTLHHDCAIEWLERRLACPMCRSPLRLLDCAIYTTPAPSLVTRLGPSETGEANEHRPVSSASSSSVEGPATSRTESSFRSPGTRGPPLPNAVDDEEEPWWPVLPNALGNPDATSVQDSHQDAVACLAEFPTNAALANT